MFMSFCRIFLLAVAIPGLILFVGAGTALAGPVTITSGYSITLSYQTTAANINGTVTYSLIGNVLTLVISNTSTAAAGIGFITAAGFDTTPNITVTGASFQPPPNSLGWWYASYDAGMGSLEHRVSVEGSGGKGPSYGLDPGESITATLTLLNSPASITLDANVLKFQNVPPSGKSEKPTGIVPEPSLVVLLGIGLLAISLTAFRWQR